MAKKPGRPSAASLNVVPLDAARTQADRLEFAVHVVSEQHETSRIGEVDSCISTGEQIYEKRNGLGHYDDMERSV